MSSGSTHIRQNVTMLAFFLACVVSIVLIFSFFTGLLKAPSASASEFRASGVFALPNGAGSSGVLTVQVQNLGSTRISEASFSCPTAQFVSGNCSGLSLEMNGSPVSPQNPLPAGQTGTGTAIVTAPTGTSFTYGIDYVITAHLSFSDGSNQTATISLPAQA